MISNFKHDKKFDMNWRIYTRGLVLKFETITVEQVFVVSMKYSLLQIKKKLSIIRQWKDFYLMFIPI